ncbi:hypothetical protein ACHAO8_006900 [Botrytis cinerea]
MKVKWILIALFVAEIVVYTAFEKYYLGGKFLKSLLSREQENDKSKDNSAKPANLDFDRVYAYYVTMGGFAADVSDLHNVIKRVTFTPNGIRPISCAAESSPIMYVPAIETEEIVCTLTTGESLALGCGPGLDDRSDKETHRTKYDSRSITISLTSKDVRRLNLAGAYISEMNLTPKKRASTKKKKRTQPLFNELVEDRSLGIYKYTTSGIEQLWSLRAENFRGKVFNDIPYDATYLSAAIALIPMVYGCAHLGALSII